MKSFSSKQAIVLAAVFLISINGFSQGEMLTKGETINYINKVVARAVGYNAVWLMCEESKRGEITRSSFTADGENVVYRIESKAFDDGYCRSPAKSYSYTFNPAHIQSIKMTPIKGISVAYVEVTLAKKDLVKFTSDGYKATTDKVTMYLLVADNKNFESFKKALLHLKDLASAEEDPFGDE